MKKSVFAFALFCVVFGLAFYYIDKMANPLTTFTITESIAWHGHVENDRGVYNGTILEGMFSENGQFAFTGGERYVGEWQNSHMTGNGTLLFPGVGEYQGDFYESKRNGTGTFVWDTGERYSGDWANDEMHGSGSYCFVNGAVLTGQFEHNKPISGTYTYSKEASEVELEHDVVSLILAYSESNQKVSFVLKSGLSYEGDLSGINETGNATIVYPSKNEYKGTVFKGKRHGLGKYTWRDDKGKIIAYYEGDWIDDHMNGQGKYHYTSNEYPYLMGKFGKDLPSGELTYYKSASSKFTTTWKNGKCTKIKEK